VQRVAVRQRTTEVVDEEELEREIEPGRPFPEVRPSQHLLQGRQLLEQANPKAAKGLVVEGVHRLFL